jgi:hypothetical protein
MAINTKGSAAVALQHKSVQTTECQDAVTSLLVQSDLTLATGK